MQNLIGKRFGKWVVLEKGPPTARNQRWKCRCDCGTERLVGVSNLRAKRTESCGCVGNAKHGLYKTVEYRLYYTIKSRAEIKGLLFDLELSDIKIPDTCPCLGIPIRRGVGKIEDGSPSVDRLDSTKGYTKDNIWIISNKANRSKNSCTLSELESLADALRKETVRRGLLTKKASA